MNLKSISLLFALSALSTSVVNGQEKMVSAPERLSHVNAQNGNVFENFRGKYINADVDGDLLIKLLGLSDGNSFEQEKSVTDAIGITHANFQQYYKGIKVSGAMIMVHAKDGFIQSINGKYMPVNRTHIESIVDEIRAADIAQEAMGITTVYRNYVPLREIIVSPVTNEPVMTYVVRIDGKNEEGLVIMQKAFINANDGTVLAIEEINAHVDVNANAHTLLSGERTITTDFDGVSTYRLLDNARNIHTLDATAAELGNWNSSQVFTNPKEFTNNATEWTAQPAIMSTSLSTAAGNSIVTGIGGNVYLFGAILRKREDQNSDTELETWPVLMGASRLPLNARNFYRFIEPGKNYAGVFGKINLNSGNTTDTIIFPFHTLDVGAYNWEDTNGNSSNYVIDSVKNPALDAHWGISRTYDYYLEKFGRSSFDGSGAKVTNYINGIFPFAGNHSNAMAMQSPYNVMMYGLGDGLYTNPFVSLDITGHEYTHLVISRNGNGGLRYAGEPGALNESYADIFGVSIDFFSHGTTANWLIGEEVYAGNNFMRSMSNPKDRRHPDTYKGQFWINTSSNQDNGGVHINSGVNNYWYYLVTMGGMGTNDNGYNYNVAGIGIEKAEQIAYRTLTQYLTYDATFEDAYLGSLQAVMDLYGEDTLDVEYTTVKYAWYAVGLGEGGSTTSLTDVKYTNDLIRVYPNPVAGSAFNINSDLSKDVNAVIYNNIGQKVRQFNIRKGATTVDVSGLTKGLYNIIFNVDGQQYVHKVTVF